MKKLGGMLLAHQLPVLRSAFDFSSDPFAVIVGGGIIVLVGVIDDRFELDSLTKLLGQITAAGVLVLFGLQWWVFWVPWGNESGRRWEVYPLKATWVAVRTLSTSTK